MYLICQQNSFNLVITSKVINLDHFDSFKFAVKCIVALHIDWR